MKLLMDIGNTRIKWAVASNRSWKSGIAQFHGSGRTETLFDQMWCDISALEKIVVSNVAGAEFAGSLRRWCEQNWCLTPHFIRPNAMECGVTNGYLDPSQLGSDRWAALIAARNLCADPLAVVDCGTAVTVDALDTEGYFRGGIILPGLTLSKNALLAHTSGIGATQADPRLAGESIFCQSTEDAVASGTVYGVVGGIDRVLDEFEQQLGRAMKVYLSGGDADSLQPHLRHLTRHDPELVLKGLDVIAETV